MEEESKMIYCIRCGRNNIDDERYCVNCHHRLNLAKGNSTKDGKWTKDDTRAFGNPMFKDATEGKPYDSWDKLKKDTYEKAKKGNWTLTSSGFDKDYEHLMCSAYFRYKPDNIR